MKVAVISPSGKFYGSEQTLYCFLSNSFHAYDVFVSINDGQLIAKIKALGRHKVIPFRSTYSLYLRLIWLILINRYKTLYVNEGGHIRYIKFLANIFSRIDFYVHLRINEDTTSSRLRNIPSNIELISVSDYIADLVRKSVGLNTVTISSPHREFKKSIIWRQDFMEPPRIKFGIIGRITDSKGIAEIRRFCGEAEFQPKFSIEMHFFGHVEREKDGVKLFLEDIKRFKIPKIYFHGFVKDKNTIFNMVDIIVHYNKYEPLGVIFFEALNNGVPFIGFNSGGIGYIARKLEIQHLMLQDKPGWPQELLSLSQNIHQNINAYKQARVKMMDEFSIEKYCQRLENKFFSIE